jgi:oxaloacetate decarboxylase
MPSRWTERRKRFRSILAGDRCVYPASVHDPISAHIAADLGFEAGMFAGSVASMAVLGAPDLIVLTLTEFAEQAHRIARAADLPLMVDADHGYGNALNVMRTVEELETAGVAGLSIEDTLLPRAHGSSERLQLLSVEEGVGKIRAALAARRDPDLVVAARTSAVDVTRVEDAVARATTYESTGADAIFLVGIKTRDQLDAIAPSLRLPIILGSADDALMDPDYLSARNVRICLQGHQPFQAAVLATYETLRALREGKRPADLDRLAPADLMRKVIRAEDYERWTREFLQSR